MKVFNQLGFKSDRLLSIPTEPVGPSGHFDHGPAVLDRNVDAFFVVGDRGELLFYLCLHQFYETENQFH